MPIASRSALAGTRRGCRKATRRRVAARSSCKIRRSRRSRSPRARSRVADIETHVTSYCGRCGTRQRDRATRSARPSARRAGMVVYPRVSPAMMALVTRGRELLLAALSALRIRAMYSALAGFRRAGQEIDRGLRPIARCAKRSASRSHAPALLRQPVVAVPAFAHDRDSPPSTPAARSLRDDPEIDDAAQWFPLDALPACPRRCSSIAGGSSMRPVARLTARMGVSSFRLSSVERDARVLTIVRATDLQRSMLLPLTHARAAARWSLEVCRLRGTPPPPARLGLHGRSSAHAGHGALSWRRRRG